MVARGMRSASSSKSLPGRYPKHIACSGTNPGHLAWQLRRRPELEEAALSLPPLHPPATSPTLEAAKYIANHTINQVAFYP